MSNDSPVKRALAAIDKLRARLDLVERERKEPIAIVGTGCRLPGGVVDLASLSARLQEGFDAVVEVPADRWDVDAYFSADPNAPGKMSSRVGGFLDHVDEFDATFFGLSNREAASLDPQHRLLLEVAWEALEDAGHPPARLRGSSTGVFVGLYTDDYAQRLAASPSGGDAYAVTGAAASFAAGRLSFLLDLRGPSLVLDTVCSSSLVAIDVACQNLRNRRCDLALAGAVSLMIDPSTSVLTSKLFALSPSGRCRAFDASADGYVRGEGCAAVVLKRLSDAVANNDRILGVIRGSAVNHDGQSTSFTAPNVLSQQAVIQRALDDAGVTAADVSYVEAHGTGTPLGDPIEIDALKAVLGTTGGPPCAVGSVKTNLGHLESVAGMAGLLKVLTCFSSERIPPHLHLSELNPHIDLEGTRLEIPAAGRSWMRGEKTRIAGVSSFGLSGTNAHVVLEEPPDPAARSVRARRVHVLPLSARSGAALRERSLAYASELERQGNRGDGEWLEDATYSAGGRREHHAVRLCVAGEGTTELAGALRAHAATDGAPDLASGVAEGRRRIVFVYSGQGSQWAGMGRRLRDEEPAFAARLAECDRALRDVAGVSVLEMLDASADDARWQRVDVIQPLLFALQVSLSAQWIAWGVAPDAVVGHSLGEVAASVVAGTLSLDDAARVIAIRSRLVSRTSGRGRMALIELSKEKVAAELSRWPGVSIASHNGPETVVVAGDARAVQELVRTLDGRGVFSRLVDVDYASHCAHMDELLDELSSKLAGVRGLPAQRIAHCSTVLAAMLDGTELDGSYWCRNLREPVRFHESAEKLLSLGHDVFIEISPHPILVPALEQTLGGRARAFGSLRRDKDDVRELSETLARLYSVGAPIDWERRHDGARPVVLPSYPWQRRRHWMEPAKARPNPRTGHGWLDQGKVFGPSPDMVVHEGTLGAAETSWLGEHSVNGDVLVPGAVWFEAAAHAARVAWGPGAHAVRDVELLEPLVLGGGERRVQVAVTHENDERASFEVLAEPSSIGESTESERGLRWTRHARGRLRRAAAGVSDVAPYSGGDHWSSLASSASFYEAMGARGLVYGPRFRLVREVRQSPSRALADIVLSEELVADSAAYVVHPALLDGCLQVLAAAIGDDRGAVLPVALEELRVFRAPGPRGSALGVLSRMDADEIAGDVTLYGEDGLPSLAVKGLRVRRIGRRALRDRLYVVRWDAQICTGEARPGRWLVLTDEEGESSAILEHLGARGCAIVRARRGPSYARRGEGAYELDPTNLEHYRSLLRDVEGPLRGILHLWAAETTTGPTDAIDAARRAGCGPVLHLAKALAEATALGSPRLWIATRGSQPAGQPVDATHAPLWGLARSLLHEHPELRTSCIDLRRMSGATEIDALARELTVDGAENQIALRDGDRFVARVVPASLEELTVAEEPRRAEARAHRLEAPSPGVLERLELRAFARGRPGPGKVEIAVGAAGINFLDVLHALGVYPGQVPGRVLLGHECAGRIAALGDGVDGLALGDEVVAIASAGLATHTIADARLVLRKPSRLSLSAAAGAPLAYLTAHYALVHLARLSGGERVLIHSASGGVGLAAIAVAKRAGAQILATAGSEDKRAYLRALGVEHVMDSRTTSFADEVRVATDGLGVDVVLNSLTGAAIEASFSVLAPYGRFIEIGKKDIYEDRRLLLSHFRRSLSYAAVDVGAMVGDRPDLVRTVMTEVFAALEDGSLPPLPVLAYPLANVAVAFRTMAAARHVGKLVALVGDPGALVRPAAATVVRPGASYVITGGLGGLGLSVARWLIDRGAERLVLLGRHGPSSPAMIDALTKNGARVEAIACDVTNADDVGRILGALIADADHPLRGVVHAAGVLDDGLVAHGDWRRFEAVMAPKVRGAQNLHAATKSAALDFFVLFSSAASLLGSPAQGSYAAANAFLDALAHERRGRGLAASTIQWGAWAKIGLAAVSSERGERLAHRGMGSLEPDEALEAFGALLEARTVEAAVISLDCAKWGASFGAAASTPYFSELTADPAPKDDVCSLDAGHYLREQIAKTFRIPLGSLDETVSLLALGCDSLTALELKNRLAVHLGVTISPQTILRAPSVRELLRTVEGMLPRRSVPEPEEPARQLVPDPSRRHDPFPLTDIQQAYWIGRSASMDLGGVGCHVYTEFDQVGLDPVRLERAWQRVIARHDMLRAVVLPDGTQRILPEVPQYRMPILDLCGREHDDAKRAIEAVREEMAHQVFAPEEWPLFDVRVSQLDGDRVRVHFSLDLIAADPATLFQLFGDWGEHYREPELAAVVPQLSFRDYMVGALAFRGSEEYRRSKVYWDARIDTLPGPPELPLVRDPTNISAPRFKTRERRLDKALWDRLKTRAESHGITSSAALLAAFADLLAAWSSSPRFAINMTLFSRLPLHPDVHEIVGDFTSTLLLEVPQRDGAFLERSRRLHEQLLEDLNHAHVSGVEVLREMAKRQRQKTLMGVVFTSMVGHRDLSAFGWLGERVTKLTQTPQVFFDHQVLEHDGALVYSWDTVDDLFPEGMLDAMFEAYGQLLQRLASDDGAWREASPLRLPEAPLARRRATATVPLSEALLHEGFEAQARARSDAPAVISSGRRLTYGELERASNRVARWLRHQGVQTNQLVALVMEKGWQQIVGALGVLKAGAAYLPIEASLPADRIAYLLAHGEVKIALTQSSVRSRAIDLDEVTSRSVDDDVWCTEDDTPLDAVARASDLAYVLYTSGSTGKPKGVAMPHRGPVNTIADVNRRLGVGASDRVLALSALSFDLSVYDVFGVLAAGGAIVLPDPESSRDPAAWLRWIRDEGVTLWNSVPALMQMLVEHAAGRRELAGSSLMTIMLSGDWIPVDLPERVASLFDGARVYSLGGPTEASIWQVSYPIERVDPEWRSIPYGTPLSHQQVHVLDDQLRPRPDWVPGEIYIGGRGLADGYWRDEARTAESFIVHPETGERLYKSGDIGRWVPAGYIEFVGRNDNQVKVQGHRIELGEIETALEAHPDVADAVVVAKGKAQGSRSLVAYVVARDPAPGGVDPRGANVLADAAERLAFKVAEHNVRRVAVDALRITLDRVPDPACARDLYAQRASKRRYAPLPLAVGRLSSLLSALAVVAMDGEPLGKFRYPSAGHLYPVQTYVHVEPGRVTGLDGGVYYYDFKKHALVLISANARIDPSVHAPPNRSMAAGAAFTIFFIAQSRAIEPLYGALARDFCMIEVGAMAQLLMTSAHPLDVGLCEVGALEFERVAPLFDLDQGHLFLHAMVGGPVDEHANDDAPRATPIAGHPRSLETELAEHLGLLLPPYMVPSSFVRLERMPLTANGKVDRRALPDPVAVDVQRADATPPTTELERRLVAMVCEAVGAEQVGLRTHLFELGFTSVHVVALARRVREELGLEVAVVDFFRLPTIEALAGFLAKAKANAGSLEASERAEKRRALLEQRRGRKAGEEPR